MGDHRLAMARLHAPLWLTAPSRFAGIKPPLARIGIALLAFLLAATLTALASPGPRR